MAKKEAHISQLQDFLPAGTYDAVLAYLHHFKVHLTVARERKSILGDYRHRTHGRNHRISVNGNLNKFSFLITLLHELAHLLTFEKYGNRVSAHGREWKGVFGQLLSQFLAQNVFQTISKQHSSKACTTRPLPVVPMNNYCVPFVLTTTGPRTWYL